MAGSMAHWQSDLMHPHARIRTQRNLEKQMEDWKGGAVATDILTKNMTALSPGDHS